MIQRPILIARVQRDGRSVDAFGRCLDLGWLSRRFPLADSKVKPRPLEELPFFGVAIENRAKGAGGAAEIVPLPGLDTTLVNSDGFVESWLSWGRRRGCLGRCRKGRYRLGPRGQCTPRGFLRHRLSRGFLSIVGPFRSPDGSGGRLYGPALLRPASPAVVTERDSSKTTSGGSSGRKVHRGGPQP